MEKKWSFYCPFDALIEAANKVAGGELDCAITFGFAADDEDDEKYLGYTEFTEHSRPLVVVRPDQNVAQALDILAHELSHVIAGEEAEHNEHFHHVYAEIHREYEAAHKDWIEVNT